ncbi:SubName: Full=Uncharacterized protein {ECO:0000313/EMBL:EKV43218.1} [Serendipita indica DSM 11827]|nr:SubName: Full=Uncharacterized protein {ECO:0000313/EMBL:EKV43218.1} [Serendipita indica DSM 11827]
MALYAGIGGVQAVIAFLSSFAFALAGLRAMSFYDTTPVGRILSRLSRDIESLDNQLPSALFQLMRMLAAVLGAIALIFYTFPYLGIAIPFLFILYYIASAFYRRTSIETKRLDSVLRSALTLLSEALTGLSTIHAWRTQDRYIKVVDAAIDNQNRADGSQCVLTLLRICSSSVSVFAVGVKYVQSIQDWNGDADGKYYRDLFQSSWGLMRIQARSEQEMNAVERLDYCENSHKRHHRRQKRIQTRTGQIKAPSPSTTSRWRIAPVSLVLHGITFDVKPGEKIGICGRTGAGKSSILQALFRIVEIEGGTIEIDGVDTRKIGLDVLRRQMAVIPQDALLFQGTVRENIDPLGMRTDAELLSALRRAGLLDTTSEPGTSDAAEATKVARMYRASNSVHSLNTIVYYDRILVLDAGRVAEFDTPLGLYDREGSIFRSLCSEASLNRQDIIRIRKAVHPDEQLE